MLYQHNYNHLDSAASYTVVIATGVGMIDMYVAYQIKPSYEAS